jgi:hypothetical protein
MLSFAQELTASVEDMCKGPFGTLECRNVRIGKNTRLNLSVRELRTQETFLRSYLIGIS